MTDPNNTYTTPVGRLVGGSLSEARTKNRNGPCEPYWWVALALPKTDPGTAALVAQIKRIAAEGFATQPHLLQHPSFAWKFDDGDSPTAVDSNGNLLCKKEGYPGHYVFSLVASWAVDVCTEDDTRVTIDASSVKTGDWVRLAGDIKANGKSDNPGIYLNLGNAQFMRADTAIRTGAGRSNADAFGTQTPAPSMPPVPAGPVSLPAPPAPDIVNDVVNGGAPPPPPAASPTLTPAGLAAGINVVKYLIAGWSEEQLRTAGHIV